MPRFAQTNLVLLVRVANHAVCQHVIKHYRLRVQSTYLFQSSYCSILTAVFPPKAGHMNDL